MNIINETYAHHCITLEDPIEYVHNHKKSIMNQREVGMDTNGFGDALRAALREDPDVILVGEMRDLDTIQVALTAAETGHLVFSTLHTIGAAPTIDRVIDVFPAGATATDTYPACGSIGGGNFSAVDSDSGRKGTCGSV